MSDNPSPKPALSYRADIDGLRAVAVLIVMAFHVGTRWLTGGYVGVDVFFVISGYLISSIMFADIAAGRFSVIAFYERRIRRIFPALFTMLIAMSVFAMVYLLPSELVAFAKTCVAASTSFSNFYLWKQSGYFDRINTSFLLHTWSLAVEEQFYILFPLFLVAVRWLFPSRLRVAVVMLFAASLAASAAVVYKSQDTAFYMPYTRAWELLLGTILSLGLFPGARTAWMRNAYTLGGVAMIGYSAVWYTSVTVFPGLSAITPCLGSALIISAGEDGPSVVSAVLSWRPVVFVGLISYSLYLWHWPVIMVYRMGALTDMSASFERHFGALFHPDRLDHLVQIAMSFALAFLSWRFVERPFRKGRLRLSGRPLFALAGAVMLVCIGISGASIISGGLKGRFSSQTVQIASYMDPAELRLDERAQRMGTCFLDATTGVGSFDLNPCLRLDGGKKNYLLLGDSHAAALWPALAAALPDVNMMQVNVTACLPLVNRRPDDLCGKVMDYMYANWLPTHRVQELILEADWDMTNLKGLDASLAWAKAHHVPVLVLGCVPEYDAPLARLLAYQIAWNEPNLANEHRLGKEAAVEKSLKALVDEKWHIPFVSLYDALCDGKGCQEYADTQETIPLMDDSHHLNRFGAMLVVRRLVDEGELK